MPKFLHSHEEWCKTISQKYLEVKRKNWDQFKEDLFFEAYALNLVGIMIWARAYHKHVCVFFGYNYWTTHCDHDLQQVHVFLLYRGNNRFDETRRIGAVEYRSRYNEFTHLSRKIERHFKKIRDKKEQKRLEKEMRGDSDSSSSEEEDSTSPSDEDGEGELDMENIMDNEDNVQNTVQSVQKEVTSDDSTVDDNVATDAESNVQNMQSVESRDVQSHEVPPETNDQTEEKEKVQSKSDVAVIPDQKDEVKETKAQPKAESVDTDSRKMLNVQKNVCVAASKLVVKARANIKGSWHFVNKKRKVDLKARTCKICGQVKDSLQELEQHMRKKHKSFKYKCRFCPKTFRTKNGQYKHKLYHTVGLRYMCKNCDKGFMFYGQYREHKNVHTSSTKNRFPCREGCDKSYGSTRARNYHEQHHKKLKIVCKAKDPKDGSKCGYTFTSRQGYNVHFRGYHGPGWDSLCGRNFIWPAKKTDHEKECTTCKGIKKRKAKKVYKPPKN